MPFLHLKREDELSFREFFIERYFTDGKLFPGIWSAWKKYIKRQNKNTNVNMGYAFLPEGHTLILSTSDNPEKLTLVNSTNIPQNSNQSKGKWLKKLPEVAVESLNLADELNSNAAHNDAAGEPNNATNVMDPVLVYRKKHNYRYIKLTSTMRYEECGYCDNSNGLHDYVEKTVYCRTTFDDGTEGVLGVTMDVPRCNRCSGKHDVVLCKEMPHMGEFVLPQMCMRFGPLGIPFALLWRQFFYIMRQLVSYDTWLIRIRRLINRKFQPKGVWDTTGYQPYDELCALGMNSTEPGANGELQWKKVDYAAIISKLEEISKEGNLSRSKVYNLELGSDGDDAPLSFLKDYKDRKYYKGNGCGCLVNLALIALIVGPFAIMVNSGEKEQYGMSHTVNGDLEKDQQIAKQIALTNLMSRQSWYEDAYKYERENKLDSSLEVCIKAYDAGIEDALLEIVRIYGNPEYSGHNDSIALAWIQKGCDACNLGAKIEMANVYAEGLYGVTPDTVEALKRYVIIYDSLDPESEVGKQVKRHIDDIVHEFSNIKYYQNLKR